MLNRTGRVAATAAVASCGLGAIGAGPAWAVPARPAHEPAVVEVAIGEHGYSPDPVTAFVGDTVTWTNTDDIPHDVFGGAGPAGLRSPMLAGGASWSFVAAEPGSYAYVCTIHEGMAGAVTIAVDGHEEAAVVEPAVVETTAPAVTAAPAPVASEPSAVAAAAAAPIATDVAEPSFELDLRLVGAALLVFALIAIALRFVSPEPDG